MTEPIPPPIVISRVDARRIEALLDSPASEAVDTSALEAELDRADIVDPAELPADVIHMNSTARFRDETSGEEREMTLVYPGGADGSPGQVSILAPVGSALLGMRVGEAIDWPLPGGRTIRLRVLSIRNQSETAGDPHR